MNLFVHQYKIRKGDSHRFGEKRLEQVMIVCKGRSNGDGDDYLFRGRAIYDENRQLCWNVGNFLWRSRRLMISGEWKFEVVAEYLVDENTVSWAQISN